MDGTAVPSSSVPSQLQDLLTEVQRLQCVVSEQQAQLHAQQSSACVTGEEWFTKSQVDTLRQALIQQFNEHMAQCEQANQAYWTQATSQHQHEVSVLQQECAAYKHRVAKAEAAAQAQQLQRDAEDEANANAATALRLDVNRLEVELRLARQQRAESEVSRDAAEAEAAALGETVKVQRGRLIELEEQLSYAKAQLQAARAEAEDIVHTSKSDLNTARLEIVHLQAELEAANAELLRANAELQAARETAGAALPASGDANPFADTEDPFGGPSCAAAPGADDGRLDAARQRIVELEAANAELLRANAELQAARETAGAALPASGDANPFADTEDPFGGPSCAAAPGADDGRLDAARQRIVELEAANAELLRANAELQAARETAGAALPASGDANPFADTEDPFGGPSCAAAPGADDGRLDAARQRIVELEAANAELLRANAELQAARETAGAALPASGDANPFADTEDPFGGPSCAAAPGADDGRLDAARQRIVELEAANAELLRANAELQAARETAGAALPASGDANPFADTEDPFGGPSCAAAPGADDGRLDAARQRIVELEAANAELLRANAELQAARETAGAALPASGDANPFADTEDPFGGPSCAAAPGADDGRLDAARQRIVELEAANAELLRANAELQAARETAGAALPASGDANPFADTEDPFGGPSCAAAPGADDGRLDAARQRIVELEAANAELLRANAELQAARETAGAALPASGDANPFADTEDPFGGPSCAAAPGADDGRLDAARQRIVELEAANAELLRANAELQAAREAATTAQKASEGDLEAVRQCVTDLEDALAGAEANLERLQEDVVEKSRLIQAFRAGEAALGSLRVDTLHSSSDSGWILPKYSEGAHNGLEEAVSGNWLETVRALRTHVADLTHELEEMRRQQQGALVSTMVPGMEALGRQYAEVEHRLALAEEEKSALEDEVQRLRGQALAVSSGWNPEDDGKGARSAEQTSRLLDSTACPAAMSTASASFVNPFYSSSDNDEVAEGTPFSAVPLPPASTSMTLLRSLVYPSVSTAFTAKESVARATLGGIQQPVLVAEMSAAAETEMGVERDESSGNTPHPLAPFHIGSGDQAAPGDTLGLDPGPHEDGGAERIFGVGAEDVEGRRGASPCTLLLATDEESETHGAASAGRDEDVDFNDARRFSRDIFDGDEDDDNTDECDASVITRAAAPGVRQAFHNVDMEGKVDDSGAAMQRLGREYADAQHRLYRSEDARQGLEAEVVELRGIVVELQAELARQPRQTSVAARTDGGVGDEAETRTITTSLASSVPTAVRERLNMQGSRDKSASSSTTSSSCSGGDGAESGSLGSAYLSDHDVSVTTAAAPTHENDPGRFLSPFATAASEDTAALYARIAELEDQLKEADAQHEEELQALAEAAADRIAAMEQQYAADFEVVHKAAATAEEERQGEQETVASLMARVTQLTEALAEAQAAHATESQALREKDEDLLRQRPRNQEDSFEVVARQLDQRHQDNLRALASSGETGGDGATGKEGVAESSLLPQEKAQYWEAQHAALLKRFDQLQYEYNAFAQDISALQCRFCEQEAMRQEQSKAVRDAAAQQLTTLHRRLEEMNTVVNAAQADAQAHSDKLRDVTARHSETEAAFHAEVNNLRSQVQSARDELACANHLNEELSELLQQGASSVETALRERDAQSAVLERQVQQLKLQLAAAGDRFADQEAALQEKRANEDALQQRLVELEEEKRAVKTQLREAQRSAEEHERVAMNAADRAARDAEQVRIAAQQAMTQQHAAHTQEVAALHCELDELRNELEVAQTVAATVPLEAQRQQRDLSTVRDRLAEALRCQQDLQEQLKRSHGEVERQRLLLMYGGSGNRPNGGDAGAFEGSALQGGGTAADARLNALLHRSEELEEKLREATAQRDGLQQERDRLSMQVKSAARVAEVKEQATRRLEAELRSARLQLTTIRDDLAQRVQSNHVLQLEMEHLQERLAVVTQAYEELQDRYTVIMSQSVNQEHANALLMAKAVTIPRALQEYLEEVFSAYRTVLQAASRDRRYIFDRCDLIEKAASEAMAEAEAQSRAYEAAIADAQEEQQQMKEIIESLQQTSQKAEEAKNAAVADAAAARDELEAAQRQAREDIFNAQRDLQVVELQHADTLHSLSLLQDEVANTTSLIKIQKSKYEQREEELMKEVTLLQAEVETRKSAARQLQQAKDESHTELQDMVDRAVQARDRAVHEAQALQAQLARVLPRLAQLEDEQAQRTADLMDTAQELSALHKKTTSTESVSRKHIEELNETLQELLEAHAALQRTHTSTEATAERLKSKLANVTEELERTAAKATQQAEELATVKARLHDVELHTSRVIEDDQTRLRDNERHLQGLGQRNTALQQECTTLQESLQSLRIEHENTVDALHRKSEAIAAQEKHVNHQLRLLRDRIETLEAERTELMSSEQSVTASRDACQREILSLEHQVEHLQHDLRASNGHNERLNQEIVQLKTDHAAEADRLREAITDAQKDVTKCRQLLAKAEVHQMEQDSTYHSLSTEVSVVREELKAARAQAERATQQCQKAKAEQEETVTLLQSQIAQLCEELCDKQERLRMLENTSAHQQDTLNRLRQGIAEAEETLKQARQELLNQQEAAAAAKEHHRRDRYELQMKLNDAEDAVAEMKRSQEQYRQRMTSKVELYEVAEEALRGEVTDLRADVARLEEALTATTHGKAAAETYQSRQAQSIKAAESELNSLRTQAAHDIAEITTLKLQLQQRTAELERCRREAAAQLAGERLRWETEHTTACDALEEALRQEQRGIKDAREARERALASLECKQKDLVVMEGECRALRAKARQLQRHLDTAQYQLTSLEGMAKDTAADLGMTPEDLVSGEGGTLVDVAAHPHETSVDSTESGATAAVATAAASGAAVQSVMDELQRRLSIFTFAANTLGSEDEQLVDLRKALVQQEDAVQLLVEVCAGGSMSAASGATPLRAGMAGASDVTPGLNTTPTPRGPRAAASSGANISGAGASAVPPRAALTAAQQVCVQHIGQASSTYAHRVEDHLRTAQEMLRSVMMAIGSHEIASPLASRPTTVALSSRHKLQVAATAAELHRLTATLTRAVERTLDFVVQGSSDPATAEHSSTHSSSGGVLQEELQELRRLFSEAEQYVLLPFNELLCVADSAGMRAAAATAAGEEKGIGGEPAPKPSLYTKRPPLVKLPGPRTALVATAPAPLRPSSFTTRASGAGCTQEMTITALSPIAPDEGASAWL
ncbi:hypothetical protein MNV84_03591 [Leishmania braziliensis]|nr:hypothetical protein MNV84_03591 [Leishmania braziliensis]